MFSFYCLIEEFVREGVLGCNQGSFSERQYNKQDIVSKEVEIQHILGFLDSQKLYANAPNNLNGRSTYLNVQIIRVSIALYKKRILTLQEIRDGLLAFQLTVKETGSEYLPLQAEILNKCLRLINKVIGPRQIQMWIEKCSMHLDASQIEINKHITKDLSNLYIFPHEFLSLLCNAQNRIENINRVFKPDMHLNKVQFNNFAKYINKNNIPGKHSIYHLEETQFQDNRPQQLVLRTLDSDIKDKVFRYEGMLKKDQQSQQNLNQSINSINHNSKADLKETLIKANRSISEFRHLKTELMSQVEQEKMKKLLKQHHLRQSILIQSQDFYQPFQLLEQQENQQEKEQKLTKQQQNEKQLKDHYGLMSQAQRIMVKLINNKEIEKIVSGINRQNAVKQQIKVCQARFIKFIQILEQSKYSRSYFVNNQETIKKESIYY
eukprot:403338620